MSVNISGGSLEFEASLDASNLNKTLNQIQRDLQDMSRNTVSGLAQTEGSVKKVVSGLIGAGATIAASQQLFEFLGNSITEALDAEASTARFKNTLESINRADAFDRIIDSADRLAQKFAYLDNDDIVGVFNKLITYGKLTEKQIQDLVPVIIDFSAKQRISLEQGSSVIIRALEGNGKSLKEFGINLKANANESERLAAIMGTLKSKVNGAGEAFLQTASGGIASARQEMADLSEELGTKLIPALNGLLRYVNNAFTGLKLLGNDIRNTFLKIFDKAQLAKEQFENLQKTEKGAGVEIAKKALDDPGFEKQLQEKLAGLRKLYTAQKNLIKEGAATPEELANTASQIRTIKNAFESLEASRNKKLLGGGGITVEKEKNSNKENNSLLKERKTILGEIDAIQRDAFQSGLSEDQKQLEATASRYDLLIKKVEDYNNRASKLGKPTISTDEIKTAKQVELENTRLKQEAEKYRSYLDDQKNVFARYEKAKQEIGIDSSSKMFKDQLKGFDSYQAFLKDEVKKNLPAIQQSLLGFGNLLNVGDREKVKSLFNSLADLSKNYTEEQLSDLVSVIQKTTDFAEARKNIEDQYNKDVKTLEENQTLFTKEELEKRKALLKQNKEQELTDLQNQAVRQSEIYRLMGQDLITSSESKLKDISKEITKTLEQGFLIDADGNKKFLTPEMVDNLTAGKDKIDGMLDKSKKVADVFKNLSSLAHNFNNVLGDVLSTLGDMVTASKDVKKNLEVLKIAQNKKDANGKVVGDALGELTAITGIVGAVAGVAGAIAGIFSKSAEERRKREQELKDFNTKVYSGEFEINSLYRERELIQVRLNDLRLQGAEQELEVLRKQKEQIQKDIEDVTKKLQGEVFKGTQDQIAAEVKRLQSLGLSTADVLLSGNISLAGKTFAELEKLDLTGQLEGTAKTMFETLKKLNDEFGGVDQAMKELEKQTKIDLTGGATKEGIADSIAEGFAQGKRSAADFADTFQDLMKKAAINALKLRFLDEPLKKFIDQFQEAVTSGDVLTSDETNKLQTFWDSIITNASKQFEQIQQLAGLDISQASSTNPNSLQGSIKNITEETATLLASQFGGLRMTVAEGLAIASQQLDKLNAIQFNTAQTVAELKSQTDTLVNLFRIEGVKIK